MVINNKHRIWNELGIDSKSIISDFKNKKNKSKSLSYCIKSDLFYNFLKDRNIFEEEYSSKESFSKLILDNTPSIATDIYFIFRIKDYFDEELLDAKYNLIYGEENEDNLKALYKICIEDENFNLLREIHYSSFLNKKQKSFIKCNLIQDIEELEINIGDDKQIERFIKSTYKGKEAQKKINVWYTLQLENGIAIFIYKKAKSKAKLAKTTEKSFAFFNYSKPTILFYKENYETLQVYSSSKKEAIKMGSTLIKCALNFDENQEISYEIDENSTNVDELNNLINAMIGNNGRDENLVIQELKFGLEPDFENNILIQKQTPQSEIIPLIISIQENYGLDLTSENILTLNFMFNGTKFGIFWQRINENTFSVYYNPYSSSIEEITNLITYCEENYNVNLLKKSK